MKESPGSLSAYFIFVGIITIFLAIMPFVMGSNTTNVIHQLFIYVSFIVGGFLIYFGITVKKYLKKSPKILMAFIVFFILFNITLSLLSGQLIRLIVGLIIGAYLINNIDRLSKEMKAKEIKSEAIQDAKANITSAEKIYYEDKDVNVTNLHAIILEEIYQISDITSVELKSKSPNYGIAIFSAVIGIFLMFCGGVSSIEPESIDPRVISAALILVGVILVVIAFVVGFTMKRSYVVKICCVSIETDAMLSKDKEYIQGIVDSINQAITDRGI